MHLPEAAAIWGTVGNAAAALERDPVSVKTQVKNGKLNREKCRVAKLQMVEGIARELLCLQSLPVSSFIPF